jgi:hypothetical protein
MREKLNDNPIAQIALIGVLLLAAGIFVMSSMGGGGEEGEEAATSETIATVNGATATGSTPGEAVEGAVESLESGASAQVSATPTSIPPVPLPAPVLNAYESGSTVALLFVHDGGIDDKLVRDATASLAGLPGVTAFVVPAAQISRYTAITEGVGVSRVPALVVVRPKRIHEAVPTASVSYGFQSGESLVQAVIDAGYEGPTVDYHP